MRIMTRSAATDPEPRYVYTQNAVLRKNTRTRTKSINVTVVYRETL